MPEDWIPNVGSQLERALQALFVKTGAVAGKDYCFISNDSRERKGIAEEKGVTDICATQSKHEVEDTGSEKWQVRIQNKFGSVVQPGEPNPSINRVEIDKLVGRQMLELARGDSQNGRAESCANLNTAGRALATAVDATAEAMLAAANDADMTEFTCQFIRFLGSTRGKPDDDSCAWLEVRHFEITACPSNVD